MNQLTKRWLFLGAGVVAYGALVTYADPFQLFLYFVAGLLWVAAPCAAVALLMLVFAAAARRSLRPSILVLTGVFVVVGLMAVSLPINSFMQERAVIAAKAYPDRVGPLLEQYRQQHGTYPATLDQLPSHPHVPRLLASGYGYHSDGEYYRFTFPQPGGLIDVWDYSSETHAWHLST